MTVERIPREVLIDLPTPCLLIDLAAADRNIELAREMVHGSGIALRPHFKAHKCTTLLKRQLESGALGATCQTPREALVLAAAGVEDILVANEVADTQGLLILGEAARTAKVTVAVDALGHVELLVEAAQASGVELGVVIELDVGSGRCGLEADSPLLPVLAEAIDAEPKLNLVGLLAYEGHIMSREDRSARSTGLWQVASQVAHETDRLRRAGFGVAVVTGGGTGTLDLLAAAGAHTEAQPGSYVLMDATYGRIGVPFEEALYCVTTVISRRNSRAGVLNGGLKSISAEQGMPVAVIPGMRIVGLADEHARFITAEDSPPVAIGDPILLIPAHVDPTVNLHPRLYVWTGADITSWDVDGRRATD